MRIGKFEINNKTYQVEFLDTPTALQIYEQLPFAGNVQRWGDEIYFDVPFSDIKLEKEAREVMKIGDIGFWISGSSIAIFFGPTPISLNNEPRAAEPINVFAKIIGDVSNLETVRNDELIYFTK